MFQRYDAQGAKIGENPPLPVPTASKSFQVLVTPGGDFMLVGEDYTGANYQFRHYDATGALLVSADQYGTLTGWSDCLPSTTVHLTWY